MKKFFVIPIFLFFIQPALAANGTPTAESVRELMKIIESRKMLENAMGQIDEVIQQTARQALDGQPLTPAQEGIIKEYHAKTIALYQAEMRWEYLEPLFVEIYQTSFNQQEIDGLIAFYQTDLGQAVIHKMPVVMQNTMQAMQARMLQFMPRVKAIQQKMVTQLQKARVQ